MAKQHRKLKRQEDIGEEHISQVFRRNSLSMFLWEGLWAMGTAFCVFFTVIPSYLIYLGASKTLVQSVMLLFPLMSFLQLFSSRVTAGESRKFRSFGLWALFGGLWIIYGLAASMIWNLLPVSAWIAIFILNTVMLSFLMHLATPSTMELVLINTPRQKRGQLAGTRCFVLAGCGLLASAGANWFAGKTEAPFSYHGAFIIGGGFYLVATVVAHLVFCDRATVSFKQTKTADIPKMVKRLWGNFNFRVFLFFYAMVFGAQSLGPLFIAYGKDALDMGAADVAVFVSMFFLAAIITGFVIWLLADRCGFRVIAVVSSFILACGFLLPLFFTDSRAVLLTGYVLFLTNALTANILLANLGSELVPEVAPTAIIAVGNTLVMPFSLALAPLMGLLVDVHGKGAYSAVFVLGATMSACACAGFLALVREPRSGQKLFIRIRRG